MQLWGRFTGLTTTVRALSTLGSTGSGFIPMKSTEQQKNNSPHWQAKSNITKCSYSRDAPRALFDSPTKRMKRSPHWKVGSEISNSSFSTDTPKDSSEIVSSEIESTEIESEMTLQNVSLIQGSISHTDEKFIEGQKELFSDPEYFNIPVLMIHAATTDFAVSYHAPDKLNELDALWSCFPQDLKIYGYAQRRNVKTVQLILNRAYRVLQNDGVTDCRLVFKGYSLGTLYPALDYIETTFKEINFVSITDLTRKLGEESPVYQRPVPRYPLYKKSMPKAMRDGPKQAPRRLVDKFTRLNSTWYDVAEPKAGIRVTAAGQLIGKYGFIVGKKGTKAREEKKEHPGLANMYKVLDKSQNDP